MRFMIAITDFMEFEVNSAILLVESGIPSEALQLPSLLCMRNPSSLLIIVQSVNRSKICCLVAEFMGDNNDERNYIVD
jgi:hypothetical protein